MSSSPMSALGKKIILLRPRGFCAGVVRAIDVVKIALNMYGAPIYVRKEIVHNRHVVEELRALGAIFVEELVEVPQGARVIFSAHGVAPEVRTQARERNLKVIDATCPLVTKVHLEAVKFARKGFTIVLIGHKDHDEVIGTLGEAPEATALVSTVEDVELIDPALSSEQLVYRLFHERGVRVFNSMPVVAQCSCSRDSVEAMLKSFSQDDRDHMVENGEISVTCEFCSANYRFAPETVRADAAGEPGKAKSES